MYTLEQLQQKTFKELKEIGWQLNVLPEGDRRCRQNWIDAIAGVNPPLLELLEVSPGVEAESVSEPIAQAAEIPPGVDRPIENFTEGDRPPNRGDNGRDRLESAIAQAAENLNGVTFSPRFLALYSPPQPEKVCYKTDANGQLSLLDFEIELADESPDPDDFESIEDFWRAMALWDSEHCEPSSEHCEPRSVLLTSLESMCEWAPCPDAWYEPSEVLELSPAILSSGSANESSDTCDFFIPTFGAFKGSRTNGNSSDEPPTSGVGARLPKPKPPSFPPMGVGAGDRTNGTKKFARSATLLSGRAPPGGDAM